MTVAERERDDLRAAAASLLRTEIPLPRQMAHLLRVAWNDWHYRENGNPDYAVLFAQRASEKIARPEARYTDICGRIGDAPVAASRQPVGSVTTRRPRLAQGLRRARPVRSGPG